MSVMTNPFLPQGMVFPNSGTTFGNIIDGGQLGFGNNLPNVDAATPLVMRPIVPIVMHAPTMFDYIPGLANVMKALIETHTKSIDGIDIQYTMDSGTTPAGQDGQERNVPTNAKRAQVNPQFVFPELNGNLVWNAFRTWMRLIKDPDTQASSLAGIVSGTTSLSPHILSMYTMDILFIQYDTTLRPENIIDGYFITSMWPNDIGTAGYKKQIGSSEVLERTVAMHGVLQHNPNTLIAAQNVAQLLQLHLIDYNYAAPVSATMDSGLDTMGLQHTAHIDTYTAMAPSTSSPAASPTPA